MARNTRRTGLERESLRGQGISEVNEDERSLSRVRNMRNYFLGALMLAVTSGGIIKDSGKGSDAEVSPTVWSNIAVTEKTPGFSVVPKFSISDEKPSLPIPDGIDMSEKRFDEVSAALGRDVEALFKENWQGERYNQYRHGEVYHFVNLVIKAAKGYPELASYIEQKVPKKVEYDDFNRVTGDISKLFIRGGYVFAANRVFIGDSNQPAIQLRYYKIDRPVAVKVETKTGDETIMILETTQLYSNDTEGEYGLYLPRTGVSLVHTGLMKSNVLGKMQSAMSQGLLPKDLNIDAVFPSVMQDRKRTTILHEATHRFIGQKYPQIGESTRLDVTYPETPSVKVDGIEDPFEYGGEYHSVHFHELAAVGISIANDCNGLPMTLVGYLNMLAKKPVKKETYFLVKKLLPLIVIDKLPDSPEKNQLISGIKEGRFNATDMFRAVFKYSNPNFCRAVGEELAAYGFDFFEKRSRE